MAIPLEQVPRRQAAIFLANPFMNSRRVAHVPECAPKSTPSPHDSASRPARQRAAATTPLPAHPARWNTALSPSAGTTTTTARDSPMCSALSIIALLSIVVFLAGAASGMLVLLIISIHRTRRAPLSGIRDEVSAPFPAVCSREAECSRRSSANDPHRRDPRHRARQAPLRGIRLPEARRPRSLEALQGVALSQEPDPPRYRKEVMRQ